MSLYTIAAASLTTNDDRKRRPAIDQGMIVRTLVLCLLAAVALAVMHRWSHAEESRGRGVVTVTEPGDGLASASLLPAATR